MTTEKDTFSHAQSNSTTPEDGCKISLTTGEEAVVDCNLLDLVMSHKWSKSSKSGEYRYPKSYMRLGINCSINILMHRFIWEHVYGVIPIGMEIDHINGNTFDNRVANLRLVSKGGNALNRKSRRDGKTSSKYPGVSFNSGKWYAYIRVHGHMVNLGRYDDEDEAHRARQDAWNALESVASPELQYPQRDRLSELTPPPKGKRPSVPRKDIKTSDDGRVVYVPLGNDNHALVDAEHYSIVSTLRWYFHKSRYAHSSSKTDGQRMLMHRLLWLRVNGDIPVGYVVDHINGNRVDNRMENLRVITLQENSSNKHRRDMLRIQQQLESEGFGC